jgi:thiosulfate/3-mercaptopyruvate sulfurtransferase
VARGKALEPEVAMVRKVEVVAAPADLAAMSATVVDASWLYPPMNPAGVDVRARYREAHPPGAVFLDLAALSPPRPAVTDVAAIAPPAPAALRAAFGAIGVAPDAALVVTDQEGGAATAPFARLALLDAGFTDVRLLDGGMPAWRAAGLPLTDAAPRVLDAPCHGTPRRDGRFVGTAATRAALAAGTPTVVDARFVPTNAGVLPARFDDVAIPADVALRPGEVLVETAAGMGFRAPEALRRRATARGLADGRRVIVTCHFGVGAAVVATALELAGIDRVQVDADSVLGWAGASG